MKYLFIGGTADGKLIDVPEKIYRWRVPTSPIVTAFRDGTSFQDQATSYEDYRIEIFRTPDGDIKLFLLDGMTPFSAMQGLIWRYTQIHRGDAKLRQQLESRLAEEIRWGHRNCTHDDCKSSGSDCPANPPAPGKEGE